MGLRLLIVDDERSFGTMLKAMLTKEDYHVDYVDGVDLALSALATADFDLVLCDIQMPERDGLDFLRSASESGVLKTTIMMSAFGDLNTALDAIRLGAYDYIAKPFKRDEIVFTLKKAEEREQLRRENAELREAADGEFRLDRIVARSERMRRLFKTVEKVARYKTTVLIEGESGTGKELTARALHSCSPRSDKPFVAVNCGAIPDNLLESELFGYVKGAFTDAYQDKVGIFEHASGGTIFLDEVGELSLSFQVKLLRVLQEEEVRRVGSAVPIAIDVRVVAATTRKLEQEVAKERFREDLYYRLNVMNIELPSLRDRPEDIPLLVEHFLDRLNQRLGTQIVGVRPDAMHKLMDYGWPGNVRELENTIERAIVLSEDDQLTCATLPERINASTDRVKVSLQSGELSVKKTTRVIEEELIRRALEKTGGNRTAASKLLELSHRALLYKIKEYQITDR